jgi:hypothetical protein
MAVLFLPFASFSQGSPAFQLTGTKSGRIELVSFGPPTIAWSGTVKGNFASGTYGLLIEHQCRPQAVAAAGTSGTIVYRNLFLSSLVRLHLFLRIQSGCDYLRDNRRVSHEGGGRGRDCARQADQISASVETQTSRLTRSARPIGLQDII